MLSSDLKKILKGEVLDDEATKIKYSHDASLFEVSPQVVVYPKDLEDVKNLVKFVKENKGASLTARAGGTDMTGGPLSESIVLDFTKYFNKIQGIMPKREGGGYGVTDSGVFYRDFEKETLKHNLLLPSYPASREICAVGGMVANNSGGEKTLAYGKTENYVTELHAILSDGEEHVFRPLDEHELVLKRRRADFEGEVYRKMYDLVVYNDKLIQEARPNVSKNSAGYNLWGIWDGKTFDLTKLFTGSQGTLGIITKIKFKLIKPKTHSRLTVIFLKDLNSLVDLVKIVMKFKPESFESFDNHTFKLAMRFLPGLIKIMKPKNIFKLAWSFLPELWMVISSGIPKMILLAELTGDSEAELETNLQELKKGLREQRVKFRIISNEEEARKYWTMRRESFNLLRHHTQGKRTAPFIDDIIVKVEKLPEFLPKLNDILDKYNLTYTIAGHVGDGNFHIIPLMDLTDPRSAEIIRELSDKVYNLVLEYGGSITAEHNDGLIRSPYLEKMYGEKVYKLFEETKHIFDPQNIFNPGKKVGTSLKYAFDHLVRG